MIGRLWWRREASWGLELNGELQPPAASVVLRGATVRTVVDLAGTALPGGPVAIVEFEAESVETTSPNGVITTAPARDTDPVPPFEDERPTKSDRPGAGRSEE